MHKSEMNAGTKYKNQVIGGTEETGPGLTLIERRKAKGWVSYHLLYEPADQDRHRNLCTMINV
jgi:hypothetical protein